MQEASAQTERRLAEHEQRARGAWEESYARAQRAEAERIRMMEARFDDELEAVRAASVAAQAAELEGERAAARKWREQARALAADAEAVQAQLHSFTDAQRASLRDSKDGLRVGLATLLERVRQPATAPPQRRLGVGGKGGGGSVSLRSMVSAAGERSTLDAAFSSSKNVSFAQPRLRSSM
jgi:hypothetical protein